MSGRIFVTTPIYYVNDVPHLGTAYTMVNADALARWHRLLGDDVLLLTGTDEHGLKIVRRAAEEGVTPIELVDKMSQRFRDTWAALDVSEHDFIRTTERRHHLAVQQFMQAIHDNGHTRLDTYEGWYCVSCEAYYSEDELAAGNTCPVHGRPVEWLSEENYFFELSKFEQRLLDWYESAPSAVRPESRRNEALGFIRGGLQDISITRTSIDWGVKVPWNEAHVFYVWYDALVNYVTAIGYGADAERFATWWPASLHTLGKDILRFHCVWWPAMCMAAGIDPPARLFVHGWLLVGGEKMAKSKANHIDPLELAADIGVDPLRYQLLRDVSFGRDGDFSYEGLIGRYNSDLANNLGNLVSRVATVIGSKCAGVGPAPRPAGPECRLSGVAADVVTATRAAWDLVAPHEALEVTWRLIRESNAELEATEPWKMDPGPQVEAVLGDALEALRIVAVLISPAMPAVAEEIWLRLGLPGAPGAPGNAATAGGVLKWGGYPGGLAVTKGTPLFPRRAV
jgi:methionyl-tRNA synthetase